jgi:hypothetical protein
MAEIYIHYESTIMIMRAERHSIIFLIILFVALVAGSQDGKAERSLNDILCGYEGCYREQEQIEKHQEQIYGESVDLTRKPTETKEGKCLRTILYEYYVKKIPEGIS